MAAMDATNTCDLKVELDAALADVRLRLPGQHAERTAVVCALLSEAFRRRGMRATLVGGSAIEFHLPDAYASDDTDLVVEPDPTQPTREAMDAVFRALGFERGPARHWIRDRLYVEVPGIHLEAPAEAFAVGPYQLRVVVREALLVERIVEWDQTGHGSHGAQAVVMIRSWNDLDMERLDHLLRVERAETAYRALVLLASSGRSITQDALNDARAAVQKGAGRERGSRGPKQ